MAKSGKGNTRYPSKEGDRGIPKAKLPKVSEKVAGPVVWTGQGGNKGIPSSKVGGGKSSRWAGTHD